MILKLNNTVKTTAVLTGAMLFIAAPFPATAAPGRFVPIGDYEVTGASAEIVCTTPDGNLLIYTDAVGENLGFVDITDVTAPAESLQPVDGGPTSVVVTPDGGLALVCVHDGEDEIDDDDDPETPPVIEPARDYLMAINLTDMSQTLISLGGQPDSIAISADGRFAAICIENERNEDLNDGEMPQDPPGFLTIVDLVGAPAEWTLRNVSFTGLPMRFPTDPEPEFVDINSLNQAAVTLQENNHIVIVNLADGTILKNFTAGTTTHVADLRDDDRIQFRDRLVNSRLEPDAIGWTPGGSLITANEGDYDLDLADGEFTGGRNWTIFSSSTGKVTYDSGGTLEMAAAREGLYPDGRSDAKGAEMEGAEVAKFGESLHIFIGAERGNFVGVYELPNEPGAPRLLQVLATGDRPEGLLAIPQRNLFVTANEGDGTISVFQYSTRR